MLLCLLYIYVMSACVHMFMKLISSHDLQSSQALSIVYTYLVMAVEVDLSRQQ